MPVLEQLNAVFQEVFEDDRLTVTPETTADDVDGWDSLSHVTLIVAVEARFHIRFGERELLTMRNVGDLIAAVESKLKREPEAG